MRKTFVNALIEAAKSDSDIHVLSPDLGYNVLDEFAEQFPSRYLNVGIAEQNAISVAAGMALMGKKVFVYSISPFITLRPYEQVRLDIAYMNTDVKLVGVGGGLSYGALGATHHAIEDIAVMRALPNMTVICPGDPVEAKEAVNYAASCKFPVYIRLGRAGEPRIHLNPINIRGINIVYPSEKAIVLTTGNVLDLVKEIIDSNNLDIGLASIPMVKPLPIGLIQQIIHKRISIVTVEEHNVMGGFGTAVAEVIAESNQSIFFKRVGIPDIFSHVVGNHEYLRNKIYLDNIVDVFQSAINAHLLL